MKFLNILIILALISLLSCKPELDEFELSKGSADFTTYVALGNSLTAGFTDGSLFKSGQQTSYPNLLAGQLQKVGNKGFMQPLMNGEHGISTGKLKLAYAADCLGVTSVGPVPDMGPHDDWRQAFGKAVHNLGIPLAKSFHLLAPGYGDSTGVSLGTANPFYVRFAASPNSTVVGDALALNPTFFTLWIGNNDILSYATGGGGDIPITEINTFAFAVESIVKSLTDAGAKGVIANIPDIGSIPYFTTVPYNGLFLMQQEQVDALNGAYHNGLFGINFKIGPNPFVIADPEASAGFRQIADDELILLSVPQDSIKCAGWGSAKPIPGDYVLTASEIETINNTVAAYNQAIVNLAQQYGLAVADMNDFLKRLDPGIIFNGETFTMTYVSGNSFSLDGIHLTPKGNAVVANIFIEAINQKFGASIPIVDVTQYRGNILP